ncbi:MAG: gfo/Idh/MocA family oxidoreductase, partial [Myxococcales bacterium]|nr:gfo/Idh/MocA family oxidoreductase [Myxococcales bacterium]
MSEAGAPVQAVVIGAGMRGSAVYGGWALRHPEQLRIVAVAEPDEGRRAALARAHGIAPEAAFADWRD